jgi:hypothetical protein
MRRLAILLGALGVGAAAPAPSPTPLRMNDVQVIGSHNSFKARIPAAVMVDLHRRDARLAAALDYYHLPLRAQLDRGVRQLEIDIFADPQGGRYADPKGERLAKAAGEHTGFDAAAMRRPGYKVFHIPDVDYLSGCVTLLRCLGEVNAWSRAHPGHLPIMVTINAADTPGSGDVTAPLPLDDAELLDALDTEIRRAIPAGRLVTPDEVRGTASTLAAAVRTRGWPSLDAARGRIYILFDVRRAVSEAYRAGHPHLRGRAMFGWYDDADPDAAVQIVQDPIVEGARIRDLVAAGVIVRTRTDANTTEARAHDMTKAEAAFASGAQAVSTDYYRGAPDPLGLRYMVALPGGASARCNPVRVTGACTVTP